MMAGGGFVQEVAAPMNSSVRRFAWRIILLHSALLIVVLGVVWAASREVYRSAHKQSLDQIEKQQELLANQTASGLRGYYDSILSDLQLFKPVDPDAEETDDRALEEQGVQVPPPPPNGGPQNGRRRQGYAQMFGPMARISQALPYQLSGRVSHLFMVSKDGLYTPRPFPGMAQGTVPTVQNIVEQNHDWIDSVDKPTVLSLAQFTDPMGDTRGFSLIGIPIEGASRNSVLVTTVPTRSTAKRFFDEVNQSGDTAAFLLDETMNIMAASKTDRIGGAMGPVAAQLVTSLSANPDGGSDVLPHPFMIGVRMFDASIIAVHPVKVFDKQWYVVLVTPQADVDAVVVELFRRTVFWAIFVAMSMTAILLSTAIQLIRSRVRAARERHALLERELKQAREIQLHWLPQPRQSDGIIDIATINSPANRISGDFYNWFEMPDGRMAVIIGDVTGHGMAAAFLMATTQLVVRNTLPLADDPGHCMTEINRQLCTQVFNGQFVTLQILVIDPTTGRVEVATAGHPTPLLSNPAGGFTPIVLEPNLILGVDKAATYGTEIFDAPPHSTLLLYTDGVVDVESASGDRFGIKRLREKLPTTPGTAESVIAQVVKAVDDFRGKKPLGDDLTMVAIQFQREFVRPRDGHVAREQSSQRKPEVVVS